MPSAAAQNAASPEGSAQSVVTMPIASVRVPVPCRPPGGRPSASEVLQRPPPTKPVVHRDPEPGRRPSGGVATLRRVLTRMSSLFLRTLREDPADAEVPSHKLLVRAGYVRRVAPGIYSWLPLGLRVLRAVEQVVREEMDAMGAQEIQFPALLPREPYEATHRWTEYGAEHLPAQGPQGRRLPARAHARGAVHPRGEGRVRARTRTTRSSSTRSRPSTGTRSGPARASCAAASSS